MDEKKYRKTYDELQGIPCVFEKILLARRCDCRNARRFAIAEREGVKCDSRIAQRDCAALLLLLHQYARFALHLPDATPPLPHGKEIKVQGGGLLGLQRTIHPEIKNEKVNDVYGLIINARELYEELASVPVEEIIRGISTYQGRRACVSR